MRAICTVVVVKHMVFTDLSYFCYTGCFDYSSQT